MQDDDFLTMWTIYDHPLDFPAHYVVRAFLIVPHSADPLPRYVACLYDTLDDARDDCLSHGCGGFFSPSPGDDHTILETWL